MKERKRPINKVLSTLSFPSKMCWDNLLNIFFDSFCAILVKLLPKLQLDEMMTTFKEVHTYYYTWPLLLLLVHTCTDLSLH